MKEYMKPEVEIIILATVETTTTDDPILGDQSNPFV